MVLGQFSREKPCTLDFKELDTNFFLCFGGWNYSEVTKITVPGMGINSSSDLLARLREHFRKSSLRHFPSITKWVLTPVSGLPP